MQEQNVSLWRTYIKLSICEVTESYFIVDSSRGSLLILGTCTPLDINWCLRFFLLILFSYCHRSWGLEQIYLLRTCMYKVIQVKILAVGIEV